MNKKGIEPIIATVLLIVIVIAAAAIVWTVVVPFIKNQMTSSQSCVDTMGLAIDKTWTCWNTEDSENPYMQIKIVRDNKDFELTGLIFKFTDSKGTTTTNVSKASIGLPKVLEERVYKFDIESMGIIGAFENKIVSVAVAPIVKSGNSDKTCDVTSTIDVEDCALNE